MDLVVEMEKLGSAQTTGGGWACHCRATASVHRLHSPRKRAALVFLRRRTTDGLTFAAGEEAATVDV